MNADAKIVYMREMSVWVKMIFSSCKNVEYINSLFAIKT